MRWQQTIIGYACDRCPVNEEVYRDEARPDGCDLLPPSGWFTLVTHGAKSTAVHLCSMACVESYGKGAK